MQVVLNFEKRHLVFLVVLACILFVVGVSAYVNPVTHVGHPANETGPGTFGAGDYVFPGNLNVNGNFGVNGNVWAVGNLYANNGAATFWWREGEGEGGHRVRARCEEPR